MSFETITSSEVPIVIKNCLQWNILKWSIDDWSNFLSTSPPEKYPFRMGSHSCSVIPQWERSCKIIDMAFSDFFKLFKEEGHSHNWWYFDYKHIKEWLSNKAEIMDINWKDFGYSEKTAFDSTLWIGTKGAHTPCHIDTYGSNLVAQIFGRKRWCLFPPSETANLQPTRIPYEESSIYSDVSFSCGCSDVSGINEVYLVDLEPGDVLFVPFHWWHYVENLTSAISVNMWIPNESDDQCRVEESLVKYFMTSVCKSISEEDTKMILNPNEDDIPMLDEIKNLKELSWCMEQCNKTKIKSNNSTRLNKCKLNKISSEKFSECLKSKCKQRNEVETCTNINRFRKGIINAFCHPEVIGIVHKKLLNAQLL